MIDEARQAVVVLGMHRSGTSAFAGAIGLLGARLPKQQLPPQPDNPKGYFEAQKIVAIHDRLLAAAGTNWFDLEQIPDEWFGSAQAAAFADELVAAIGEDFDAAALFVVKDPRMCRLWPIWHTVLARAGAKPFVIIVLRNPLEVARSLEKRDGISFGQGCLLWLRYVLKAERETRGLPRVFVHYENLLREPVRTIEKLAASIGLGDGLAVTPDSTSAINAFVEPRLRHNFAATEDLGRPDAFYPWLAEVYGALNELACDPKDKAAERRLDRVNAHFEPAITSFAPLLATRDKALAKLAAERLERTEAIKRLAETMALRTQTIARLEDTLKKRADKIVQLEYAIKEQTNRNVQLEGILKRQHDEIGQLRQAIASLETELGHLRPLDKKLRSLENTISEFYGSTSWRVTKPLRLARQFVDRLR